MVVKSATKYKLMNMGIHAEHAQLLANDRKMAEVEQLSPIDIAKICDLELPIGMVIWTMIHREEVGSTLDHFDSEIFEVTCPGCAETRSFSSIVGPDGAGAWLDQHITFHGYQRLINQMAANFGDEEEGVGAL